MSKKRKTYHNNDNGEKRNTLQRQIMSFLENSKEKSYSLKQIAQKLHLKKKDDIKLAGQLIDELLKSDRIIQLNNGSYRGNQAQKELTGIVDHVSSRFAYIRVGGDQPDIFIKGKDLGSAVDGDTVNLVVFPTRHGEHPEGKVTGIVKRNRNRFVGKVELSKNFAFVVPDFRKIHADFFIYPENINGAKAGDKVIIEVTSWAEDDKKAEAKVVEILGKGR